MKCQLPNGEVKHFPNNDQTAHTLIKAGLLTLIENEPGDMIVTTNGARVPKMQAPAEPKWYVGYVAVALSVSSLTPDAMQTKIPAIIFEVGTSVYERFTGTPDEAKHGFGLRQVPDEILKNYKWAHKEYWKGKR